MEISASVAPIESFTPGFGQLGLGCGERTEQTGESALIANLVWIKSDPRALALQEHLQQTIAVLEARVHRNRKQSRVIQDEILRIVVLYCGLQVLLLLCVAYSNALQCHSLWTPVALSTLASIITFCGVAVTRISELRREGPKYLELGGHRRDSLDRRARPALIDIFVVVPLVSFSVIILASFWHMLCKS